MVILLSDTKKIDDYRKYKEICTMQHNYDNENF